jgi:uncharacterized membrane protein
MAHTLVAAFQNRDRAREAVRQLEAQGFNDKDVSLVAPDDRRDKMGGGHQDSVMDGTAWGAGIGGAAGLLAAAGAIAIPGIGPLIAAGPLAAALTGATAGGLTGAFVDMGIPAASGKRYEDELRHGHSVVTVQASDEKIQTARSIVQAQGAHDIEVD